MKMIKAPYDLAYWDRMLRQNTGTAQRINAIRWHFLKEFSLKAVLDYGSGVGWFRAFSSPGVEVDTYDTAAWPQTGILHDHYDLVAFWDVLEHIGNFEIIRPILSITRLVAFCMPILPKGKSLQGWKHFKPGEHLHYFTKPHLEAIFGNYEFKMLKEGYPESECGIREDIYSAVYFRKEE